MAKTSTYGAGVAVYMAALVVGSTLLTMFMCGWGFEDSLYYVAQTLWTVGYGDLTPPGDEGMVLSIVIILFGTVGIASALGVIGSAILDRQVARKAKVERELEEARVKLSKAGRPGQCRRVARRRRMVSRDMGLFIAAVVSLVAITLAGTLVFSYLQDWDLLTSLYFTVYTIATVGYGNVEVFAGNRLFVAVFIIVAGTVALACIGAISNWMVAAFQRRAAERRLRAESEELSKRMGVVGTEAENELRDICTEFSNSIRRLRRSASVRA